MRIYVGYILSDYARPLWMSAKKETVKKAIADYKKRGGHRNTWIEEYEVTNELVEFECD